MPINRGVACLATCMETAVTASLIVLRYQICDWVKRTNTFAIYWLAFKLDHVFFADLRPNPTFKILVVLAGKKR